MPEKIILRIREHHCVYVWCVCVWRVCAVCVLARVWLWMRAAKRGRKSAVVYIYVRNMHIISIVCLCMRICAARRVCVYWWMISCASSRCDSRLFCTIQIGMKMVREHESANLNEFVDFIYSDQDGGSNACHNWNLLLHMRNFAFCLILL